jgi:hypothetical protein
VTSLNRFSSRRQRLDHGFLRERLHRAVSYRRFELVGEEIAAIPDVRILCNSDLDLQDLAIAKAVRESAFVDRRGRQPVGAVRPGTVAAGRRRPHGAAVVVRRQPLFQLLKIGQVLMSPAGALIFLQVFQVNKGNGYAFVDNFYPRSVARFKFHARQRRQQINTRRRIA